MSARHPHVRFTALAALLVARAAAAAPPPPSDPVPSSSSREPVALVLHLDDALARAQRANWDLLDAMGDLNAARADARSARAWPNPVVSGATSRVHADGHDATPLGNSLWERSYDSAVQLGEEIELGGRRGARRRAARASVDAAHDRVADARRSLAAAVVRAYAGAALAEANARIAEQSAGFLHDEARIAEIRLTAGDISSADRDQIEIAASRLDLDARAARAEARNQRIALEALLGSPSPTGDVVVADSLESLAERALAGEDEDPPGVRPDVAAARADLRRADALWSLERAKRLPDPTLFVSAEHAPPERPNSFGAGLSLPLPLFDRNAGAIAEARTEREGAERRLRRTEAQAASDAAAARASLDEARERWLRYRDELRPRSEAIRRAVSLAYEKGGASLLDLLEAQRNDNDVRLATMQAASDLTIARAAWSAATTTLDPNGESHP